jgi:hypothetical protein
MSVNDETLMAFADGELGAGERAEVEAALARDPALRERLEAHQRLRSRLSAAFDGALMEAPPDRLVKAAAPRGADVVNLAERRAMRWSGREWGAMAASVAAGLFMGVGVMNMQTPLISASPGGLEARGALAQALDTQLASDEAGLARMGVSFVSQDGDYCRTFSVLRSNISALACREGEGWAVVMTAQGGGGEVRMAGAPEAILAAVDAMIAGEPLDQAAEAHARAQGWRAPPDAQR